MDSSEIHHLIGGVYPKVSNGFNHPFGVAGLRWPIQVRLFPYAATPSGQAEGTVRDAVGRVQEQAHGGSHGEKDLPVRRKACETRRRVKMINPKIG